MAYILVCTPYKNILVWVVFCIVKHEQLIILNEQESLSFADMMLH